MILLVRLGAYLVFGVFLVGCFFLTPFVFLYEILTGRDVRWFDELAGLGW